MHAGYQPKDSTSAACGRRRAFRAGPGRLQSARARPWSPPTCKESWSACSATCLRLAHLRRARSGVNASMGPTGLMIVHTGLLARMRNEAQLASVLGHEAGHYLRRHSLQLARPEDEVRGHVRVALGRCGGGRLAHVNYYGIANAVNVACSRSIFSQPRARERGRRLRPETHERRPVSARKLRGGLGSDHRGAQGECRRAQQEVPRPRELRDVHPSAHRRSHAISPVRGGASRAQHGWRAPRRSPGAISRGYLTADGRC